MKDVNVEGALKLVRNDDPDWDWWTIELAEHENRHWLEPTSYGSRLMYSGRICDACVEGGSDHMRGIAAGIRDQKAYHAKRCSVEIEGDRAFFYSPRNSEQRGSVPLGVAEDLAKQIEEQIQDDER